jgi:hypothetical protein
MSQIDEYTSLKSKLTNLNAQIIQTETHIDRLVKLQDDVVLELQTLGINTNKVTLDDLVLDLQNELKTQNSIATDLEIQCQIIMEQLKKSI